MDEERKRKAGNEARLRARNEALEAYNAAHTWVDPPYAEWLCECGDTECAQPVELTIQEYERVREDATHFLVVPSAEHVGSDIEHVVERHDRYWVVEKVGVAAAVAEARDPRSDDDG